MLNKSVFSVVNLAVNVALPVFAAERRAAAPLSNACRRINEVMLRRASLVIGGHVGEWKCPWQSVPVFYRAMLCIRGTSHGSVSVCPSVCPSQVGVLLKRLNVGSREQHHTIAQGL